MAKLISDGHHRAFIYDRGGTQRLAELKNLSQVRWNRKRDAISDAQIDVQVGSGDQDDVLAMIRPNRHELKLFRDDDDLPCWEGPILTPTYSAGTLSFTAQDICYYLFRTVMHNTADSSYKKGVRPHGDFVTTRMMNILTRELVRKETLVNPPNNILPWVVEHHKTTDAHTTRKVLKYTSTVWAELDYMAANNGMDYTVLGRALHMWDTNEPAMGQTAAATEKDFLSELYVTVYGSQLSTRTWVADGNGHAGYAGPGIDPYYGEWEVLSAPFSGTGDPTKAQLTSQAQRNYAGKNPTPMLARIPDGSSLNPDGILKITDLVPGVYVPLRVTRGIREVNQMQKLSSMQVVEDASKEDVQVTFGPATADDLDTTEGSV